MPPVSFREGTRKLRAAFAGVVMRLLGWRGSAPAALILVVSLLSADKNSDAPILAGCPPFALTGIYSTDFTNFPKWRGMLGWGKCAALAIFSRESSCW
jgi:hypothetical protein